VLALLLKKKPGDTFKTSYAAPGRANMFPASYAAARGGRPPVRSGGLFYKPTLTFTRRRPIGTGATNGRGDIVIGRAAYGLTAAERSEQIRLTLFHERVHQMLAPKLNVLRELRAYMQMSAYRRSYLLRYIEEAMAETYAQVRVHGIGTQYLLKGLKFPVNAHYAITITALRSEAAGILLGPIVVGGMTYNVYYGASTYSQE
jgi:hypothetical protein